jgi:hypothetical protein
LTFSSGFLRLLSIGAVAASVGCVAGESAAPSKSSAAAIAPVSDLTRSVVAGSTIDGGLTVRVTDASNHPVTGVTVAFTVTAGNGATNPRLATTDATGEAHSLWTAGTIVGANEVTASVTGVADVVRFTATGTSGSITSIALSAKRLRLLATVDTLRLTARSLDPFGNATDPAPVFTVRDPSLVSVDPDGLIHALSRGTSTYVVASAGGVIDSVFVTVLAPGQSICTGVAEPVAVAIGQVITDVSPDGFCVHADASNAEYALVPFYDADVQGAAIQVQARGQGITTVSPSTSASAALASAASFMRYGSRLTPGVVRDEAREARMRAQERREAAVRLPALRSAMKARYDIVGGHASAAITAPSVGDILSLNTNATDFCENPDVRVGRVVAVTNKAIVVADTANPVGGFTSDEYRAIGVTFDTLVDPTDRRMFGDPSDIDNNGRAIMFFTRAVNELTAANASSVYLGYYYQRDLYPKTSSAGNCPGSNVGEVFYLLVPDPTGIVNGNVRSKSDVVTFTLGTVAHEYQHLINASRRMYVNKYGAVFEQKWLDEGLAHAAEDLNFWASSGRAPRSNLDVSLFNDARAATAYNTFMLFNQRRYTQYLGTTETQGPIGSSDTDDDLYTRGAIWSFLRYAADRLGPANEQAFWHNLVNDDATGLPNLASALGTPVGPWLRDWAISNYVDDNVLGSDPRFVQPSFNFRSIMSGGGTGTPFPLSPRALSTIGTTTVTLASYGVAFLRFSVPNGQDALLTATSLGQSLPSSVQLAIVRVR